MRAPNPQQRPGPVRRRTNGLIRLLILHFVAATGFPVFAQRPDQLSTRVPMGPGETLVIGFLGGVERWNDEHRSVRRLALRLRETPGVHAESIANRHWRTGEKLVRRALDTNANGKLDPQEKAQARVILYGQSLGGGAVIRLARKLNSWGVPVLLTAQVDSFGLGDGVIPPNVRSAVNYYQNERLTIRGRREIRAADGAKTHVIGNFRMRYPMLLPFPQPDEWHRKIFGGAHARMEADPLLWAQVELIVRAAQSGALDLLKLVPLQAATSPASEEKKETQ